MATITPEALTEEMQSKKKKRGRIEQEQTKWGLIFLSPWLIGIVVFYFIPFIASFGFSIVRFNLAVPEDTAFIGLENWRRALFNDP
ncbi:MAG: sugar ABC transporter permease, partial [Anaerolineales bacterium]|nr:sugar ABC transporter permease [Anaerolineales bacterium]